MPFLIAQSAIGTVACGSVKLVRTMNGDASVIADVPAAITTIGVLPCVAIGAVAIAAGVTPKPASTVTFSLTTSSCARRRDVSGTAASSLTITCTVLPPALLPFCACHSLTAASIWRPVDACGPVIGRIKPIFTTSPCACAHGATTKAAPQINRWRRSDLDMARVSSGRILFVRRLWSLAPSVRERRGTLSDIQSRHDGIPPVRAALLASKVEHQARRFRARAARQELIVRRLLLGQQVLVAVIGHTVDH